MSNSISYPNYLWWVIPERLAGMPYPPLEDLSTLYQAGLRGVVPVIDEPSLIVEYQQAGLSPLWLPITEDKAPTVQQVKEFVRFADEIMALDGSVAVHCTGGNHRTGTLLAAYFVAKGENPQDVIERIQQIHATAQLSESQIHFLHQLPQLLELDLKTSNQAEIMSELISYPDYVWWVKPGKLAGMPRPPLEDLEQLYQAGLGGLVSVMDEPSGISEYQQAGLAALWIPIIGGKAPTVEQVKQFVTFADPIMAQNQPVAVHCTSGNRRTGTLLAAYLVAKGENPSKVIEQIQQVRPTAELREAQIQFLHELPALLS